MLKGNQKKLDKNNNNRIDAQDFKILKAEKAKGRGQGLQDEKMKPGKVMKARVGKSMKKDPTKPVNPFEKKSSKFIERRKKLMGIKSALGKSGRIGAAAAMLGLAGAGAASLGQKIGRKLDEAKKKNKKMGGGMMKRPMGYKAGMSIKGDNKRDIRKTESMIGASKSSPREKSIKKMGGGMMQRPIGMYKTGTMVMARGCKLGRKKATKIT